VGLWSPGQRQCARVARHLDAVTTPRCRCSWLCARWALSGLPLRADGTTWTWTFGRSAMPPRWLSWSLMVAADPVSLWSTLSPRIVTRCGGSARSKGHRSPSACWPARSPLPSRYETRAPSTWNPARRTPMPSGAAPDRRCRPQRPLGLRAHRLPAQGRTGRTRSVTTLCPRALWRTPRHSAVCRADNLPVPKNTCLRLSSAGSSVSRISSCTSGPRCDRSCKCAWTRQATGAGGSVRISWPGQAAGGTA
jgi:hypothetical protein